MSEGDNNKQQQCPICLEHLGSALLLTDHLFQKHVNSGGGTNKNNGNEYSSNNWWDLVKAEEKSINGNEEEEDDMTSVFLNLDDFIGV
jgi:hypothetical protein